MESIISPEMRLFAPGGERLYLTAQERQRFGGGAFSPVDKLEDTDLAKGLFDTNRRDY
ncbi:MAG: hypothetical protein PHI97_32860 [Desulfobulbus sp.]|nr:hypothetical protein [Desulfobulbus sp.]